MDRAERRFRAQQIAERRFHEAWLSWFRHYTYPGNEFSWLRNWTPPPVGRYRKRTTWGCNCRKGSKGRPHVGGGLCYLGDSAYHVRKRRQAKALILEWLQDR